MPALKTTGPVKLFHDKRLCWARSTKNNAKDGTLLSALKLVENRGNLESRRAGIMAKTVWSCTKLVQKQAAQVELVAIVY